MDGSERGIRDAVTALLHASDPAAQRACLIAHPDELLSEHADSLLDVSIAESSLKHGEVRRMLAEARERGLLPVLARLAPVSQQTVDSVKCFLELGSWHYAFRELQTNTDKLTSTAADVWMENLSVVCRHDTDTQARITARRNLAQCVAAKGLDGARKWLIAHLIPNLGKRPEATVALLGLYPTNSEEWRELLDEHMKRIWKLPRADAHIEATIDLLEHFLSDVLGTATPAVRAASDLALGKLYPYGSGERAYNRSRAVAILNDVLSRSEAQHDVQAAASAHALLGEAMTMQSSDRAAALRRAIGHLRKAQALREKSQSLPDPTSIARCLGYSLISLAERTPSRDDRRNILLQALQTLEQAHAGDADPGRILEVELARAYAAYAEFEPTYYSRALALAASASADPEALSASFATAYCQLRYGQIACEQREFDPSYDLRPLIDPVSAAIDTFASLSLSIEYAAAAELLGDIHSYLSDWDAACAAYDMAMMPGDALATEAFTVQGREETATSQSLLAAKLGYCLCRIGQPERATLRMEGTKLRIVLHELERRYLADADLPPDIQRQVNVVLNDMRALEAEARMPVNSDGRRPDSVLGGLQLSARQQLDQLVSSVSADERQGQSFELTAQDVLDIVPRGGALLIPFITPVGTALIILKDNARAFDPLQVRYSPLTLAELKDLVFRYAKVVENRRTDTSAAAELLEDLTYRMWDVFISSVVTGLKAHGLAADAPVTLVSHGGLGMLPLIAATDRKLPDEPLLEHYAITCVPGLNVIAYLRKCKPRRTPPSHYLLATLDTRNDLPFTRLEGALLRQFFRRDQQKALVGPAATSKRIVDRLSKASHAHFACHAQFDFTHPWQSGIELADGKLIASQIAFSLDRHSHELVVLSACESGISDIRASPNEHSGLPAAFLISGAKAIVSSQWAVNDASSALLISKFYHYYIVEKLHVQIALGEAQRWLRKATTSELQEWLTMQRGRFRWWWPSDWPALWVLLQLRCGLAVHEADHQPFKSANHWAAFVVLTCEP